MRRLNRSLNENGCLRIPYSLPGCLRGMIGSLSEIALGFVYVECFCVAYPLSPCASVASSPPSPTRSSLYHAITVIHRKPHLQKPLTST